MRQSPELIWEKTSSALITKTTRTHFVSHNSPVVEVDVWNPPWVFRKKIGFSVLLIQDGVHWRSWRESQRWMKMTSLNKHCTATYCHSSYRGKYLQDWWTGRKWLVWSPAHLLGWWLTGRWSCPLSWQSGRRCSGRPCRTHPWRYLCRWRPSSPGARKAKSMTTTCLMFSDVHLFGMWLAILVSGISLEGLEGWIIM